MSCTFALYIFRGQGIKSLSLVAKTCREKGFLIPVLKKIVDEDNIDTGYEGATVMEPIIGFHKKPIPVLDFNSLYPSSIISMNVSFETFLCSSQEYDNLGGYIYNDIYYKDSKNEQIHCRFAKKMENLE